MWKFIVIGLSFFLLISCQSPSNVIPADIIIEYAHSGGSAVEFNNSETILASGGWSGFIRLWKLPSGSKHYSWKAHDGEVTGIHFMANDKQLISSGYDSTIKLWSASGQLLKNIDSLHRIGAMVVNEQDNLIITGHNDGVIRVWDLSDFSLLKQKKQHNSPTRSVAYAASNGMIASSGSNGDVMLWQGNAPSIKLHSSFTDIRTLAFSENDQILLGGGWFNLYRWTLKDHSLKILDTKHSGIIRKIEPLNDGKTLATISRQTDSAVLFIDSQTGLVKQHFQSHELCGVDVTVSKNQNFMATTSDDASVRIWWLKQTH